MHVCVHTCTCVYIHARVCTYMHVCVHTCTCVYIHARVCTYIIIGDKDNCRRHEWWYAYIHTYLHAYQQKKSMYICIQCICAYGMHIYILIYIHTKCIHACVWQLQMPWMMVCIHAYLQTYVSKICIHAYIHACVYTYMNIGDKDNCRRHEWCYAYMHTYLHTHKIHVYMHACVYTWI